MSPLRNIAALLIGTALLLWPALAPAAGLPVVTLETGDDGTQSYSLSLQVLLLMTALTLLPALLLTMTAFTRVIIVLGLLRQALGTGQTPSNQVLLGLALFLSFFIMAPVLQSSYDNGVAPYLDDQIEAGEAFTRTMQPIRGFMLSQTRESDLLQFAQIAGHDKFNSADEVPLQVLAASFVTSELKTAFQIGFLIFIPFIVIDLVVASVLMSMGMMMLSPMLVSLPFKIMLFVLVDGWSLITASLVNSFMVV